MATLTVQIVSGLGTSTKTLTFSAADATRIMNAFQGQQLSGGTQDQMAAYFAGQAQRIINQWVATNETTVPQSPVMT